ncbi:hypothetical protein UFOVP84_116 [uncultured Caudovirales phage]|uniref:Uncharacterized protein n=1 Tax=uncultured Caudovirales phage TaxID=2100421 RepID=A0A6J5L1Y3_9CAUD|nr:hypothetical protein UFOVP84_116 [uncultured Caudovirales phage]
MSDIVENFNEEDMFPHRVLENKYDGMHGIQFTDGEFNGIIFSYGKVEFPETDDNDNDDAAKLSFDYDVHDNAGLEYDKDKFEQYLGDFLVQLIMYGIKNNDIVYTGGIDENRDDNIIESDNK